MIYPNPFNGTMTIRFRLDQAETVSLSIWDTGGRLLQTIYQDASVPKGVHSVAADCSQFPSGLYLYRFEYGGIVRTGKMVQCR